MKGADGDEDGMMDARFRFLCDAGVWTTCSCGFDRYEDEDEDAAADADAKDALARTKAAGDDDLRLLVSCSTRGVHMGRR